MGLLLGFTGFFYGVLPTVTSFDGISMDESGKVPAAAAAASASN